MVVKYSLMRKSGNLLFKENCINVSRFILAVQKVVN
jgi:hypothetical protein